MTRNKQVEKKLPKNKEVGSDDEEKLASNKGLEERGMAFEYHTFINKIVTCFEHNYWTDYIKHLIKINLS